MTTYTTREEAIAQEITAALGQYADEHDIDAIADEVLYWHDEVREDGSIWLPGCGYRRNQEVDFWEVVEKHAL